MSLPPPGANQNYVIYSIGFIILPEKSFVSPNDGDTSRTGPLTAFLVPHPGFAGIWTDQQEEYVEDGLASQSVADRVVLLLQRMIGSGTVRMWGISSPNS